MIGLLVIQAIRLAGCAKVIAIDLEDSKLEIAKTLGADYTLNPSKCDVVAEVAKLTGGKGADVALEVVGISQPCNPPFNAFAAVAALLLSEIFLRSKTSTASGCYSRAFDLRKLCIQRRISRMHRIDASRSIKVEPLITATAPLEDGPKWFERLYAGEPGAMKVILKPEGA